MIIGLTVMSGQLAYSQQTTSPDQATQIQWGQTMANVATPGTGCFQATYPNTVWESTPCSTDGLLNSPVPPPSSDATSHDFAETVGNGSDYVLVAPGLISTTAGTFPAVTGVTYESSVGRPAFGDEGILGSGRYDLQINTNNLSKTSACSGGSTGCTVWQQFLYSTYGTTSGAGAAYIEYWLIGYGATCPSGYTSAPIKSCYKNSAFVSVPNVAIANLGTLELIGTAAAGSNDSVSVISGTTVYSVSAPDSVLDIATVWDQSEFNIFGDGGGSEAVLNSGSAITVNVAAQYGSTTAPTCGGDGTTGETNNLTAGTCTPNGGTTPAVQFTETWVGTSDSSTVTEGKYLHYQEGSGLTTFTGFFNGSYGSISPTTMADGYTYQGIYDVDAPGGVESSVFILTGLSEDPGQGWLGSVTALGVTKTGATSTYEYLSGQATWSWSNDFGFTGGGTAAVKVTHQ